MENRPIQLPLAIQRDPMSYMSFLSWPQEFSPNHGSNPSTVRNSSSADKSSSSGINPDVRIASLEQELKQLRDNKAEAEITVLFLVNSLSKKANSISALKEELSRVTEEKEGIKAELESALATITNLDTLLNARKQSRETQENQVIDDLIDLSGRNDQGGRIEVSPTLLDESSDDVSEARYEDEYESEAGIESPAEKESEFNAPTFANVMDLPGPSYIYHFTKNQGNASADDEDGMRKKGHGYVVKLPRDTRAPGFSQDEPAVGNSVSAFQTQRVSPITSIDEATTPIVPAQTSQIVTNPANSEDSIVEHPSILSGEATDPAADNSPQEPTSSNEDKQGYGQGESDSESSFDPASLYYHPSSEIQNIYRTVLIANIPTEVTITQLLEKVRGGVVCEAKLLDTKSITGKNSGMITFLHQDAAVAYQQYADTHPIILDNVVVKVTLLRTATWPIPELLRESILNDQQTRCIRVTGFPGEKISPPKLRNHLRPWNAMDIHDLEYLAFTDNDTIVSLRFTSIQQAVNAYRMLISLVRVFSKCRVYFAHDPCAEPLESLEAGTEA